MKKLLLSLLLLFSSLSYSQEYRIVKVNDTISNGYISESVDYPKRFVIKTEKITLTFDNVIPGDATDKYYTLYSNDDNFEFDVYESSILVKVKDIKKQEWIQLYHIKLKDNIKSVWFNK